LKRNLEIKTEFNTRQGIAAGRTIIVLQAGMVHVWMAGKNRVIYTNTGRT